MYVIEEIILIRGSVRMFELLYVHKKREDISPSLSITSLQDSTLPLTNFFTYPLCFLTAYSSDVKSQLFSRESGGASD